MAWLGFEEGCIEEESFVEILRKNGIEPRKKFNIELLVKGEWAKFIVYEVHGFIEGSACSLAEATGCRILEGGKHLILGEVSAKIWDEAVKVCEPGGDVEIIPVYTYDAFLDVRMPSKYVRGLDPEILVGGKVYRLPLSMEDLEEIARKGLIAKVEKAASVYGLFKIVSEDALRELRRRREEREREFRYEVDYESGYVVVMRGGKMSAVRLPRFAVMLAEEGRYDDLKKVLEEASPEARDEMYEALLDLYYLWKTIGKNVEDLEVFLKKEGILEAENSDRGNK